MKRYKNIIEKGSHNSIDNIDDDSKRERERVSSGLKGINGDSFT
jgi:hypothetical protein